jgi:primosomal protein N' (replication factor Y)
MSNVTVIDPSTAPVIWRCALPTPLRRLFDYWPPESYHGDLKPGVRIRVPFGRRTVVAMLMEQATTSSIDTDRLRGATAVIDAQPLIPQPLFALLKWTAAYYQHPIGEVLPLGLSPGERRGKSEHQVDQSGLALSERGRGLPEGAPHQAPRQAALLKRLATGPASFKQLSSEGFSRSLANALLDKGLADKCTVAEHACWQMRNPPLTPSREQTTAINAVNAEMGRFSVHLLYGVTGSGKTEVYLQCIAACLAKGMQVLVLLPEIALTPQTLARFEARFDAPLVALHSGIGDAERDRSWAAARRGQAAIILGTRSAVFVPLEKPGLIIVDEEHDAAYVQQDGLRYSARDVAIKRGQLENCPVLLGSATPSLESWLNADRERYQKHVLTQRAGSAALPEQRLIDMRGLELTAGLSQELLIAIERTLNEGNQVLLFLNRRGFANALSCHDCGWTSGCRHCDARMTLHKLPPGLHCHHCGDRVALPRHCPECSSGRLLGTGLGTQQAEAYLRERFAEYPVIRVDSDTMSKREAMPQLIARLSSGDPVLLVGTQMLSKGHHFPHVTLVGIVDADALLFSPDFRGEERLLQLLTQVSGRAGRADKSGSVLIQTRQPEHPLMSNLNAPYHAQLATLLSPRAHSGLPPYGALGVIRCDSKHRQTGLEFLQKIRAQVAPSGTCRIIGPLPAAMARRKDRYRSQLVVAGPSRAALASLMASLVEQAEAARPGGNLSWSVDIDPYESL